MWHAGDVDEEGIALIPVLDMLDHHPSRHVAWHTGPTGKDNLQFITQHIIEQVLLEHPFSNSQNPL